MAADNVSVDTARMAYTLYYASTFYAAIDAIFCTWPKKPPDKGSVAASIILLMMIASIFLYTIFTCA